MPRCALLLSVVGAYNSGYEVRPSARGSPKLLPTVATSHIRKHYMQSLLLEKPITTAEKTSFYYKLSLV